MINANKQYRYEDKILTYDREKSQRTIVPIYHDIDGQLYMPLDERFVTVNEVISALEVHLNRSAYAG